MIEIYLLEQLAAFDECGTLSAAAEKLHLAQPSLSRSMQKLEGILGVSLFDRQKNRVSLNQTGALAAKHARNILNAEAEMERNVRAFDRSLRTLTIGSCAPGPLMVLLPRLTGMLTGQTVSSVIAPEAELLRGLEEGEYGTAILNRPLEVEGYFCRPLLTERLYLSVNHFHPAAIRDAISFAEMNGQNFIMYAQVGFWEQIVREKMPRSKFFLQSDMEAVGELARYSDLPSFSTDVSQRVMPSRQNGRVNVPFSDPEAQAAYYLVGREAERGRWDVVLRVAG